MRTQRRKQSSNRRVLQQVRVQQGQSWSQRRVDSYPARSPCLERITGKDRCVPDRCLIGLEPPSVLQHTRTYGSWVPQQAAGYPSRPGHGPPSGLLPFRGWRSSWERLHRRPQQPLPSAARGTGPTSVTLREAPYEPELEPESERGQEKRSGDTELVRVTWRITRPQTTRNFKC